MQQLTSYWPAIFVVSGIVSAALIAADLRQCRQGMRIMNSVWILTGLWAGVIGLWAYFTFGRTHRCSIAPADPDAPHEPMSDMQMEEMSGMKMHGMPMGHSSMQPEERMQLRPRWQSVVLSTLHCGAGCTLADLLGEWLLYFFPLAIGGSLLAGAWSVDYLLALAIGIGFQYAAIRAMNPRLPRRQVVRRAAKADLLSLTAWQIGMYSWMAIVVFGFHSGQAPPRTGFYFWAMMQAAMACGFLTSLPINAWLIRKGIKQGM